MAVGKHVLSAFLNEAFDRKIDAHQITIHPANLAEEQIKKPSSPKESFDVTKSKFAINVRPDGFQKKNVNKNAFMIRKIQSTFALLTFLFSSGGL